jgi:hypothetical protein
MDCRQYQTGKLGAGRSILEFLGIKKGNKPGCPLTDVDRSQINIPTLPLALWDADSDVVDTYYMLLAQKMLVKIPSQPGKDQVVSDTEAMMVLYHFKQDSVRI